MSIREAATLAQASVSLSRTHPHAPLLDVFDLVMKVRAGQTLDFSDAASPNGSLVAPSAPFGQLLAAAFDEAMTPAEWKGFTDAAADARLQEGCLEIWRVHVIPRFEARYGVVVRGLP